MSYTNPDLRALAASHPCQTFAPGVAVHREGTTVWAHSNQARHGKAKGMKAHDCFGALACADCHAWLDTAPIAAEAKNAVFQAAMERTLLHLWTAGLIGVVKRGTGVVARPNAKAAQSKVLPRRFA